MKLRLISSLLLLTLFQAQAQEKSQDVIKINKGTLTVHPIEHATMALSTEEKTIYVDPTGGAEAFKGIKPADIILVTDIHPDHFDTKTLEAVVGPKTVLITPPAVAEKLPQNLKAELVILKNEEKTEQQGFTITAIAMYNIPKSADAFHIKGRGNGYLIRMGGKNIYISGDTEDIPEMRNLKNIDIAFVCMNLPYTMDVKQAASAVLAFKPKIIYPYHYRGQNGFSDVAAFKQQVTARDKHIDVRLLDWYPSK